MLFMFRGLAILFWLIITVHITGITAITDNLSLTLSMTLGAFLGSATPVGGGVVTSWMGNEIDVVFFCSAIILYSEKESVATPSAVIVMTAIIYFNNLAYILFSLLIVVCSLVLLNYMWHLNQREIK
jgi:uncharacterized membrane protein YeiH